jgi:hypothetical protein
MPNSDKTGCVGIQKENHSAEVQGEREQSIPQLWMDSETEGERVVHFLKKGT